MKMHGIALAQGSEISNLVVDSGASFPSSPDEGELFFRTDGGVAGRGLYCYIGGTWDRIASSDSLTAPLDPVLPTSANEGDIFYRNSNDANEGLYAYNGTSWMPIGAGTSPAPEYVITGDVTGTLDGTAPEVLTLATVNSTPGTVGNQSSTVTVTVNAKGLVTSATSQQINIDAAQVTSGTFADARISSSAVTQHQSALALNANQLTSGVVADGRIPQSAVTQHQGALALSGSQITSGTIPDAQIAQSSVTQHQGALALNANQLTSGILTDARVAESNVTQHQASLTITETQITDGTLLARVGSSETVTGNWSFNNPVIVASPTSDSHATTKLYVDNIASGITPHAAVRVATTADISLTGTQTIDGVSVVAGDRVLVKNQSTASQNGIYVVSASAWTRATDFDGAPTVEVTSGDLVFVSEGTTNANTSWVLITTGSITVGTTPMNFSIFSRTADIVAGTGLTRTGNSIDVIGTAGRIVANTDSIDLATVGTAVVDGLRRITTDDYGRVIATSGISSGDLTNVLDSVYVNVAGDTMTGDLMIAGNVGIGTTSPNSKLEVAISDNDGITIEQASAGQTGFLNFRDSDGIYSGRISYDHSTDALRLSTLATERMRITSTGNVGIGTTDPGTNRLRVVGETRIDGIFITTQSAVVGQGAATDNIGFEIGGSRTGDGAAFIDFWGHAAADYSARIIRGAGADGNWEFINTGIGTIGISSGGEVRLATAGTDRITVTNTGNVGIGTTSPNTRLTISSSGSSVETTVTNISQLGGGINILGTLSSTAGDAITWSSGGGGGAGIAFSRGGSFETALTFYTNFNTATAGATTERMRIDPSGNVLIGTLIAHANFVAANGSALIGTGGSVNALSAPAYSGTYFSFDGANNLAVIQSINTSTSGFAFHTKQGTGTVPTERFRMDSAGNLLMNIPSGEHRTIGVLAGYGGQIRFAQNAGAAGDRGLQLGIRDNTGTFTSSLAINEGATSFGTTLTQPFSSRVDGAVIGGSAAGSLDIRHASNVSDWGITASSGSIVNFYSDNGSVHVFAGNIAVNGATTSYLSASDERLKKNIVAAPSAVAKVKAIQVRSFDWKVDDAHTEHGFVAQELNQVMPEAVSTGETWAVDPSKLVATLTKALQEALNRIESLEVEVQVLKSQ